MFEIGATLREARERRQLTWEQVEADTKIRAKYLLGADGSRSKVAADVGLPLEGQMAVAGSMNIFIEADLAHLVADRPSVLYWILQPGSTIGGVGMGVVRMVRPWNEWLLIWGYDIDGPEPQVDEAEARRIAHRLIGDDSVDVKIRDISLWTNNRAYMTRYSSGRVFCMGDACHRHPPNNGLGANTSIQDSYNLAWKLALVLRGAAGPALLDTYDDERAPVGRDDPRSRPPRAVGFGTNRGQPSRSAGRDPVRASQADDRVCVHVRARSAVLVVRAAGQGEERRAGRLRAPTPADRLRGRRDRPRGRTPRPSHRPPLTRSPAFLTLSQRSWPRT